MIRTLYIIAIILLLAACSQPESNVDEAFAKGWFAAKGSQCVPFARKVSGINIHGNAHTWWHKAKPENKLSRPEIGAVMVLSKTRRLRLGHLAVVTEIISPTQINVTHTNWGKSRSQRHIVYESMRVKDVSRNNDWSSAVFWNPYTKSFGSPYKVSGFIACDNK